MKKILPIALMSLLFEPAFSQSFELEQIEQVWRPRVRTDFRYFHNSNYRDTSSFLSYTDQSCGITFPIKTKLSADLKLDLSSLKLKDILKNSVRVKASQLMGSIKVGAKQLHLGLDSSGTKNLYSASAGIFGLKLTRKYRILFYSLNAGINEQDKTLPTLGIRVNGIIGQFHLRGLRKNYFYGMVLSYSDGVIAPIPFFGGMEPINDRLTFNYLLPAQLSLQYKFNNKNYLSSGISLDGFRSAMLHYDKRINMNYGSLAAFCTYKIKVSKTLGFKVNGGYNLVQRVKLNNTDFPKTSYNLKPGFFVEAGIFTFFGKNFFEQIAGSINENIR